MAAVRVGTFGCAGVCSLAGLLPAYSRLQSRYQFMTFRKRSMNPTYREEEVSVTVASPASSSMAVTLHSPPQTARGAVAPVRGAATYKALGR